MQPETTSRKRTVRILHGLPGRIGGSRVAFAARDLERHRAGEVLVCVYEPVVDDCPVEPPVEGAAR